MTIHVLQLGPYPPPEGGVSRNMLSIRDQLLSEGDECTIITTTKGDVVPGEKNVHRPRSVFTLLKLLASLRFDILHLHVGGELSSRVIGLAAASSFFGRGRSVLTLHSGAFPDSKAGRSAKPNSLTGFVFRRFRRIIAVNDRIADVFRRYGVREDSLFVIRPFALKQPDENIVVPPEIENFYASHSPVLLSVGGLETDYDPIFQVSAMKDILADFPDAGLVLVGSGSMLDEVESIKTESGYGSNILIAGNVEHAVTLKLIGDADILLRTTFFDGDAIAVREALFLGTPVIATDNKMRPEGVHLINIGNSAGLVRQIKNVFPAKAESHQNRDADTDNIREVIALYKNINDTNRS